MLFWQSIITSLPLAQLIPPNKLFNIDTLSNIGTALNKTRPLLQNFNQINIISWMIICCSKYWFETLYWKETGWTINVVRREEWHFLSSQDEQLAQLRQRALTGRLRACRFRSVCWRLLLGVLSSGHPHRWSEETRLSRDNYDEMQSKLSVDPWTSDGSADDPLSQEEEVS